MYIVKREIICISYLLPCSKSQMLKAKTIDWFIIPQAGNLGWFSWTFVLVSCGFTHAFAVSCQVSVADLGQAPSHLSSLI